MRTAELETVEWRTDEMIAASRELVVNYAQYSGIEGTQLWPDLLFSVTDIIQNHLPDQCFWRTPGFNLTFSGFPPTLPRIAEQREEQELEYSASPPHFVLSEGYEYDLLTHRRRNHISRVTKSIVKEMEDVYKLDVKLVKPVVILEFPKDKYATRIDRFEVPLLTPPQS